MGKGTSLLQGLSALFFNLLGGAASRGLVDHARAPEDMNEVNVAALLIEHMFYRRHPNITVVRPEAY
jgi:hypothetical protein